MQSMTRDLGVGPSTTSIRKSPSDAIRKAIEKVKSQAQPQPEGLNDQLIAVEWAESNELHQDMRRRRASILSLGGGGSGRMRSKSTEPMVLRIGRAPWYIGMLASLSVTID